MNCIKSVLLPAVLVLTISGCTVPSGRWGRWGHMMPGYGWGIMWLVIFIVAGVTGFLLFKTTRSGRRASGKETPLDILKKRYAKGEIDREEFQRKKREIQ